MKFNNWLNREMQIIFREVVSINILFTAIMRQSLKLSRDDKAIILLDY